jgi:mannose-6-phosphate isomerase-like protein (cupin superfamily)
MGRTGDRYEMPEGAGTYVLTRSTADTGGELVEFEFIFPKDAFAPPPHVHVDQVEEYEVLEGVFDVIIDGERRSLAAGESASVPVGAVHTFANPAGDVRVRNVHRPALEFEDFVERMHRVSRERGIHSANSPRIRLYLSMIWRDYPETLVAARRRDRIAMALAARLAGLLGLRKHLPPKATAV